MKSILIETVLVSGAILFWMAVLSVAVVFFPVFALLEKIEASMPRSPIGPVAPHFTPASR